MSDTERSREDGADRRRSPRDDGEGAVEAIAASTVRLALLVLGLLLLLYAVGQAVGFDVLAMISDALDTQEARWLIVAFFALVLITISLRGFR